MNKKQWKAVADFCAEYGYETTKDLLIELKGCGIVDGRDTLNDLGEYPNDDTYDGMMKWLQESIW